MKSLHKALDIIERISEAGTIGISELASATDLPPSTIHRILSTLSGRGYIQQQPDRRYLLSPKFLILGSRVQQQFDMVAIARPHLEALMSSTRENANLCVRNGDNIVYIDHVPSASHDLRIFTRLGGSAPLYASGTGKIFLSQFSPNLLDAYLDRVTLTPLTPATLTVANDLRQHIAQVRANGHALDDQEKETGVRCVAAPVFDHSGQIAAAVSISGATQRITRKRLPKLTARVVQTARRISLALGCPETTCPVTDQ